MIKKLKNISLLLVLLGIFGSCKLDLLDNPNAPNTSNLDINFLLNRIQLRTAAHFDNFSDPGMRLTRMLNQGAAIYDNAVTPGGLGGAWETAYADILIDVKKAIEEAEKLQLFAHAGVARIIRAYVLTTLVDAFGDVPYSQALDEKNLNPKMDSGADIYKVAFADIDKAIENFAATSKGGLVTDVYFGGNTDNWIRFGNSIKLKMYLNLKLTDKAGATAGINALVAGNKLISTAAQSFIFRFGTNLTNPDTRHPRYAAQYTAIGSGDYQSNSYMGTLYASKGFVDPRMRYYFYRQTTKNSTNVNQIRCITNSKPAHYGANDVFCYPTPIGYWGRDHLSNEGIPPDGLLRTAWGIYPAGGLYDDNAGKGVSLGAGSGGAGIHPILTRSFVDFMLAESALTLGTTGNARTLLRTAVEKSMADVRSFVLSSTESTKIASFEADTTGGKARFDWSTEVTRYVDKVMADYDAATTDDQRLNIIGNEYWLALYGNGIEAFNLYRRTGKPSGQQPGLDANAGAFVRSYYYPTVFIARNSTVKDKQKANVTVPVFWDNNPAGFVK